MSRLKKKLLLYFLLISIVSISVSAEIILEISSAKLENEIESNFFKHIKQSQPISNISILEKSIKSKSIFEPIYRLRNRMLLFLLFISGSIAAAFVFFTKDIISPMDGIVDATKKIVNGDLTVSVPVVTEDEIGLIASLINDMNNNLTNMVNQVRSELNKYKITLIDAHNFVSQIISEERSNRVIEEKIIHKSEFKQMLNQGQDVIKILTSIIDDLTGLQKFLNMYKTYSIKSELSQKEIDEAVNDFKINSL